MLLYYLSSFLKPPQPGVAFIWPDQRSFILNNLPWRPLSKSIRDNCLASELTSESWGKQEADQKLLEISGEWVIHREVSQTAIKKKKKYHWNIPQGKIVLINLKRWKSSKRVIWPHEMKLEINNSRNMKNSQIYRNFKTYY